MAPLLEKLERPVLTDAEISLDVGADALPDPLPDLYHGEPVVTVLRLDAPAAQATLSAKLGHRPWEQQVTVRSADDQSGIGVLWAREKVRQWMRRAARGEDGERVARAVTELGMAHHLVTRYTSLVAVDVTPVRPADAELDSAAIQGRMPAGLDPTAAGVYPTADVHVALAAGATPSQQLLLAGTVLAFTGLLLLGRSRSRGNRA
jgi:Ca-activated chloride channel family protein